jgi:hypothetical protein
MVAITSGASATQLTVTPGESIRATEMDSSNSYVVTPVLGGAYCLPLGVRFTGAVAAGSAVWGMFNGAVRTLYVTKLVLCASCEATATLTAFYQVCRFTVSAMTGGTALTPRKKATSYGASTVADARVSSGLALGVVGVTIAAPFAELPCPNVLLGNSNLVLDFTRHFTGAYNLAVNEGICIVVGANGSALAAGNAISGMIEWYES